MADAAALQDRDEFNPSGWIKLISPAKVNLHLAIGKLRDDGYHEAVSVMHALNLHDVVYARRTKSGKGVRCSMVPCGDVAIPPIASDDNLATRAVRAIGVDGIELRIEKHIPVQGGLGGGSSNAAAALVASALLTDVAPDDPAIEKAARSLGADVAFFLHGGCSCYVGAGDEFVRDLEPSKQVVVLVKPECGVSTAAAYRTFDARPEGVPDEIAANAARTHKAQDVILFNNLASASEQLEPELTRVRTWLGEQQGVEGTLLCGSGATTFAVCADFASACRVVAQARRRKWWSRATSFGAARAVAVAGGSR